MSSLGNFSRPEDFGEDLFEGLKESNVVPIATRETMQAYFKRFAGKAVDVFVQKENPEQFLDMTEMFVVDQIMNDDFFEDYSFEEQQAADKIKLLEDIREVFASLKLVCALKPLKIKILDPLEITELDVII